MKVQISFIKSCYDLKNPKRPPKIKMAAKVRFLTEKLTETPPFEQTFNYFWMQEYYRQKYFKPLKCSKAKIRYFWFLAQFWFLPPS
jgi:hypothetical protein